MVSHEGEAPSGRGVGLDEVFRDRSPDRKPLWFYKGGFFVSLVEELTSISPCCPRCSRRESSALSQYWHSHCSVRPGHGYYRIRPEEIAGILVRQPLRHLRTTARVPKSSLGAKHSNLGL